MSITGDETIADLMAHPEKVAELLAFHQAMMRLKAEIIFDGIPYRGALRYSGGNAILEVKIVT